MDNKKEYLNEENYKKTKKKLKIIALIILIVGVLIGSGLIITGIVLSNNANGINIDLNPSEEYTENLRTESEVQADINELTPRINSLNFEVSSLQVELWSIQTSEGMSDNYKAKLQEKEAKETELLNLKTEQEKYREELSKIKASNNNNAINNQVEVFESIFNNASNKITKAKYIPYYIFGGFIIVASVLISIIIYIFAKKREITAFTVQQTIPIAHEGIEKISPTIGNAVETIAKSIKNGINEVDNNKK